jgi:hypothetical protein
MHVHCCTSVDDAKDEATEAAADWTIHTDVDVNIVRRLQQDYSNRSPTPFANVVFGNVVDAAAAIAPHAAAARFR